MITIDVDTDTEFARIVDELSRRGFLAGGLGAATLAGLAACGSSSTAGSQNSSDAGPWTFTDDLGRKVTLPNRPTRIAALGDSSAATLWAAGLHVVAAPLLDGNRPFLAGAGVPASGVVAIQGADGIVTEKLAAVRPDLIIDDVNDGKLQVSSQNPQIAKIAPVLGLNSTGPTVDAIIDSAHRVVRGLGITTADSDAHTGYSAAEARLRTALKATPGLRAMFCFANGADGLCIMGTAKWPFMQTLAGLGLHLVQTGSAATGASAGYFTTVSWEDVPSLPVDLVIYTGTDLPSANSAWKAMPAIRAGQLLDSGVGWYAYYYSNYITMFDKLAVAISKSRAGVGPR